MASGYSRPRPAPTASSHSIQAMNILAIVCPRSEHFPFHFREVSSVQEDLNRLYNFCLKEDFRVVLKHGRSNGQTKHSRVKVVQLLASSSEFKPNTGTQTLAGAPYEPEIFYRLSDVREAVQDFLRDDSVPNKMIYFSGHGTHWFNSKSGRSEEALELNLKDKIYYTDSKLTEDVNYSLPSDQMLYLALDACHSEGMLNLWELMDRTTKNVVLFAGASTDIQAAYTPHDGGYFTKAFTEAAVPGKMLCQIQEDVLEAETRRKQLKDRNGESAPKIVAPTACYSQEVLRSKKFLQ